MADGAPARSVILATDEAGIREGAAFAFPGHVEVLLASDAREAWEQLRASTPSVAIVDLRTGSAGGFALARDMAAVPRLAKIPILMLLERSQDSWLARQAGAKDWIVRPFGALEIVEKALEMIEEREK